MTAACVDRAPGRRQPPEVRQQPDDIARARPGGCGTPHHDDHQRPQPEDDDERDDGDMYEVHRANVDAWLRPLPVMPGPS